MEETTDHQICKNCGSRYPSVKLSVSVPQNLLTTAQEITGITSPSALMRRALQYLIESVD